MDTSAFRMSDGPHLGQPLVHLEKVLHKMRSEPPLWPSTEAARLDRDYRKALDGVRNRYRTPVFSDAAS